MVYKAIKETSCMGSYWERCSKNSKNVNFDFIMKAFFDEHNKYFEHIPKPLQWM